ncbi:hypothetical protein EOS_03430 [Caballeronia mineralivorans PML1(12)]|uniref:Tyr recombinase domain-containing protein n=1 Tax=Caballeronia mineralivorans PML1(12) TaxID=908627 RepID=A0A0J1G625_9BURK|nr:integrase family protein [Caballeronia mineralivorans]KLU27673.1 hypothetical protein EOS_03430 [Caballeronia mineralivorans PML1(12)]
MKLSTNAIIDKLAVPTAGYAVYWDDALKGFGVRVTAAGKRTYIYQGRPNGKTRRITLGEHGVIKLDKARSMAATERVSMQEGIDPAEEKRQAKLAAEQAAQAIIANEVQGWTLREIMTKYLTTKRTKHGPLKDRSKKDIERHMDTSFATWADKPIRNITTSLCLERFNYITQFGISVDEKKQRPAPAQANQAFVLLRALCNFAFILTEDDDEPLLPINPVARMFKRQKPNKEEVRTGRIPSDKIGAVWSMLQKRRVDENPETRTSADYVCLLLLTGSRATEGATLTWTRFSAKASTWTIPSAIAKNHNAVTLPMSTVLCDIIDARPRVEKNNHVFASWGKTGHITEARATMDALSAIAGMHLTPHDLRRTFEDIGKACGVDADQRRQLLNHLPSDVHGKHYDNNPDPRILAPAVERIAAWVVEQSKLADAKAAGEHVTEQAA